MDETVLPTVKPYVVPWLTQGEQRKSLVEREDDG